MGAGAKLMFEEAIEGLFEMMPFVNKPAAPGLPQRVVVPPVLIAALVAVTFFCVSCSSTAEASSTTVAGAVAGPQSFSAGPTAAHATTTSVTGATPRSDGSADSVTSGAASGEATATTKSTKTAGSSTTTSEPLYFAPGTTVAAHYLQGTVMGSDGRSVAGATVYVLQYGEYEHEVEQVDFTDHGGAEGDRRLPVGAGPPPLLFEDLLPGRSAAR